MPWTPLVRRVLARALRSDADEPENKHGLGQVPTGSGVFCPVVVLFQNKDEIVCLAALRSPCSLARQVACGWMLPLPATALLLSPVFSLYNIIKRFKREPS